MMSSATVTLWTGWDVRGGASAAPQAEAAFANFDVEDPEAVARFELIAVAARGFRPPRFLTAADLPEDGGYAQADGAGLPGPAPDAAVRETWSLLYRRVAETTPPLVEPYAIYLLGVNPPEGATDEELQDFNDFYTNVHLPEVADRRHALRAVRYELLRELRPPYNGAPRFLAAYELDEAAAAVRRHVGPPYASGPDVWQRHTTPWRLWYRRLPGARRPTRPAASAT